MSIHRETGTADRPTGSRQVAQVPYLFTPGFVETLYAPTQPVPRIPDSDTQGEGKSPGMRWPWKNFFESRAPSVYTHTGSHWPHELPSRVLIAGERGPLDRHYLDFYEQATRHAWPGGGVIEYPATAPVVNYARRIGEAPSGVAI